LQGSAVATSTAWQVAVASRQLLFMQALALKLPPLLPGQLQQVWAQSFGRLQLPPDATPESGGCVQAQWT
jgi:hypothetical protein